MPEDTAVPPDDPRPEAIFTRVTTETVKRGDLYVPLADRFDKLEKRVSILTWVVVVDIILTLATSSNPILGEALKILAKLTAS